MKRKLPVYLYIALSLALLTGCWDQKLLKDTRFILTASFDKDKEGNISGTYSTPSIDSYPASSIITTVKGKTVRDVTTKVNEKVAETLDNSKVNMIFFGEKLAKEDGIYPYLDLYIREPNNPINPYVLITEGKAEQYLKNPIPNEGIPSNYYRGIIETEIDEGLFTNLNIFKSSRLYEDSRMDIVAPYMKQSADDTPVVGGLALFDSDKFSGETLNPDQSILYNMLAGNKARRNPQIVKKIKHDENPPIEEYVVFNVLRNKRKMDLNVKNGKVKGIIYLKLGIEVIEYPLRNNVGNEDELSREIEKAIGKDTEEIMNKLQKANCDGLSIGLNLHSFHYNDYKKLDWKKKDYKNADIKTKVTVEVLKHGLID